MDVDNTSNNGGISCDSHIASIDEVISMRGFHKESYCATCSKNIAKEVRVHCMECPSCDLCVECFSRGKEVKSHKRTHAYTVIEKLEFPLFAPEWSAEEEIQLLETMGKFGYNNWLDAAEYMHTSLKFPQRTIDELRDHYINTYVQSPMAPRPDLNRVINGSPSVTLPDFSDEPSMIGFYPKADTSFTPPKLVVPLGMTEAQAVALHAQNAQGGGKHGKPGKSQPTNTGSANKTTSSASGGGPSTVIGYLPLRGDFDVEWDNDAELTLADMEFIPTESPAETALKLRVLHIYNSKLDQRARRKQFVLERGLLDLKSCAQREKRRPRDERELVSALRPLERFHSPAEHEEMIQTLAEERRLRERLERLLEWRALGLTSLEQAVAYDRERSIRAQARTRSQSSSSSSSINAHAVYSWCGPDSEGAICSAGRIGPALAAGGGKGGRSISDLAGWQLLSASEQGLCEQLKLPPQHYLVIKRVLLRTAAETGRLSRQNAIKLLTVDPLRANRLFEYFVSCNWIKPGDATSLGAPTAGVVGSLAGVGGPAVTPSGAQK